MRKTPARAARTRRTRGLVVLGVALLLAGGGYYVYQQRSDTTQTETTTGRQTATASRGELRVSVSGPGTLAAAVSQAVLPEVSGTITTLPSVGQTVTKGETVATIDDTNARRAVESATLALQQAQAQVANLRAQQASSRASSAQSVTNAQASVSTAQAALSAAEQTLASNEALYAVGGVARQVVDDARAAVTKARTDLQTAQAAARASAQQASSGETAGVQSLRNAELSVQSARLQLQSAQRDLAATRVTAPLSGVVSEVPVTVGSAATTAQPLMTIIDTKVMDLPVQIDETQISGVKVGQPAEVTFDAIDGRTFDGQVRSVSPSATTQNNIAIFTVTVRVPNEDGTLRAGMSAEAEIISQDVPNVVLIPRRAVETVRTRSYVQIAPKDPKAEPERRRVRTGADDGTNVAVLEGLEPGETVLLPTQVRSTTSGGAGSSGRSGGNTTRGGFGGPPGGF